MLNVRATSVFGAIACLKCQNAKPPFGCASCVYPPLKDVCNGDPNIYAMCLCLVSEILVAEASSEQAEEEAELQELVFRIRETEESKLFRKFLDTWDNHFNKQRAPAPLIMHTPARKKKAKVK